MAQQTKQRPEREFRSGRITTSIWAQEADRNGRRVVQFSIRFQKRYRDKNGAWQDSSTFFPNELPRLRLLIDKAYEYVAMKTEAANEAA